jgi:hypothetical protein
MEWGRESEEATLATLHLQLQLSQFNGMVPWHSEFTNTPVKMRKDERVVMFCMMQHIQGVDSTDSVLGIVKRSAQ